MASSRILKIIIPAMLLCFIGISMMPLRSEYASLYWDELAIGIDAYSIVQTGKDIHGNSWLQAIYPSYGDYKAPVAIWLSAASVKLFGLSAFSIRLPFFLAWWVGIGGLLVLSWQLKLVKQKWHLGFLGLFLVTCPWVFHFSHIGFESGLSFVILMWTLVFAVLGLQHRGSWLLVSSLWASLSVYAYVSARYITPLFLIVLFIANWRQAWKQKGWLVLSMLLFLALMQPLSQSPFYQASQTLRWSADNIMTDSTWKQISATLIQESGNTVLSRLVYHRYWFFITAFLEQYLSHVSLSFLGINGDVNLRHHSGFGGQLLLVSLPFVVLGFMQRLTLLNRSSSWLILGWLAIAPLTAAIPKEVPHASRAIYMILPVSLLFMIGIPVFLKFFSTYKVVVSFVIVGALMINFSIYLEDYLRHYPSRSAQAWQYGNRLIGEMSQGQEAFYEKIVITEVYRLPALSVLFFNPDWIPVVQSGAMEKAVSENYDWLRGFGPFQFKAVSHNDLEINTLYLTQPSAELAPYIAESLRYPNGSEALYVIRTDRQLSQ